MEASGSSNTYQETPSPVEATSPEFFEVCSEGEESEGVTDASAAGSKRQRRPSTSYAPKKKSKLATKNRIAQSTPITLKWLGDNYMEAKDQCLPRSTLYMHYQDFCKKNFTEPVSQASFGKFIRQKFPNLSTRRLGTRGQSKYHYYGIAIRETSPYFHSVYSRNGLTRFATHGALLNPKKEANQYYSPNSKCGTLLPEFPSLANLKLKPPFPVDKLETFLMMYRTHCQRIVDTVVRTNFDDVQEFLVHFWQGMPSHLLAVLGSQTTVDLITVCDFITYQTLLEVLVPSSLQPMSEGLMKDILQFSGSMLEWLMHALTNLPTQLAVRKCQVAEMFSKQVAKQISLITLSQPARNVLRSSDAITGLLDDWRAIKFAPIVSQAHTVLQEETSLSNVDDLVSNFCTEFEKLLLKQPTLDVLFEWVDSVVEQEVAKVDQDTPELVKLSRQFHMLWNHFSSSIERELTLNQAKSYSSFKDLVSVLDEYVFMVTELLLFQNIEKQYRALLTSPKVVPEPLPAPMVMEPAHLGGPPCHPSAQPHPSTLAQPRPQTLSVIAHALPHSSQPPPTHQSVIYQPSGGSGSFQPGNSCHGYSHPHAATPPQGPVFPKAEPEYHSPCSSVKGVEQPHPLPYNATSFPMTPSPSHASSSSLSASPEPMTFDPLPFPETTFEVCPSGNLLTGNSPHYDYTSTAPRYHRVDSIPSVTCSSQCSFHSDCHTLMSPSLATPKEFLAMSPLATNEIGCLFDSAPYNSHPAFYPSADLDWLGALTPDCEEKLFDPCGLFAPSGIPVPLV